MIVDLLNIWAALSTMGNMINASKFIPEASMPVRARDHGSYDLPAPGEGR
jgi:hypothetical protein